MNPGKWLVGLLAFLAIVLFSILASQDKETERRPKVEQILAELSSSDIHRQTYARTHLRSLGTNAVPELLRRYGPPEPPPSKVWWKMFFRQRRPRLSPQKIEILSAFSVLGKDAAAAVPVLVQELQVSGMRGASVDNVLVAIGEPAVDPIISLLKTNAATRHRCISILAQMDPPAERAIPILTNLLAGADQWTQMQIVRALGYIKSEPHTIVPLLARELTNLSENVRSESAASIANYGTNALLALNELESAVADSSERVRIEVASALAAAQQNEKAAETAESVLNSNEKWMRSRACALLTKLDLAGDDYLNLVRHLVANKSEEANVAAIEILENKSAITNSDEKINLVFELLKKPRKETQSASIKLLARLTRNSHRDEEICKVVFGLEDGRLKREFLDAMYQAGFVNFRVIRTALLDSSPLTRQSALEKARALGEKGSPLLPAIATALEDSDRSVSMAAVEAAANILPGFDNTYHSWPVSTKEARAKMAAVKLALGIPSTNTTTLIEDVVAMKDGNTVYAVNALLEQGKDGVPLLEKILETSDFWITDSILKKVLEKAVDGDSEFLALATRCLGQTNGNIEFAFMMMCRSPLVQTNLPLWLNIFENGNESAKYRVSEVFIEMETNAIAAKPALERALADPGLTRLGYRGRLQMALQIVTGKTKVRRGPKVHQIQQQP